MFFRCVTGRNCFYQLFGHLVNRCKLHCPECNSRKINYQLPYQQTGLLILAACTTNCLKLIYDLYLIIKYQLIFCENLENFMTVQRRLLIMCQC